MKRRWLLLFGVFMVAVLGAGWLFVPFASPRISQPNFDKLQAGWTLEQVEELLGERGSDGTDEIMWIDYDMNVIYASFAGRQNRACAGY